MDGSANIICKLKYLKVIFIYYIMEDEQQPISDNESTDEEEPVINDDSDDDVEEANEVGDGDGEDEIDDELGDLKFPGDAEAVTPDIDLEEVEFNEEEIGKPSIEIFDQPGDDSSISDLDSDDEEDIEVNYLKKIDDGMKKNILESFHPECIQKNFDEINFMCVTERDKNNIIIDKNHKTIPFLSKYERCRVIGTRVKQLNSGAKPLIELKEAILDNYIIANRELRAKKLPFIIQRPIANGKSEYWNINDLEFLE
jgi:DNA-directed RNA polymerase subunit K/omega